MHDFDLDQVAEMFKTAKAVVLFAQQLLPAVTYLAETLRERHRRRCRTRRHSAKVAFAVHRKRPAKRRRR